MHKVFTIKAFQREIGGIAMAYIDKNSDLMQNKLLAILQKTIYLTKVIFLVMFSF